MAKFTACIHTSANEAKHRVRVPYHIEAESMAECKEKLDDIFKDDPYAKIGFIVSGHLKDISGL